MAENILITGANGEIGHSLIQSLSDKKNKNNSKIVALDTKELDKSLVKYVDEFVLGDILNKKIIKNIIKDHQINTIFHLAAILSTAAEKNPEKAHRVNVGGTINLLEAANKVSWKDKRSLKFIFPSTIAVYGMPNLETKKANKKVKESEFTTPITIYGASKLYCEKLGVYYSSFYKLLDIDSGSRFVDFRSVRFPGLISATTMPTGGTSDYAPEMIHSAARGKGYESFVTPKTTLPFMVMPDAIKALINLANATKEKLSRNVYNVGSFSATADQIAEIVNNSFPDSAISYNPDKKRQKIVDSWPADVDDSAARTDWGWLPDYNIKRAFEDYLIPEIKRQYK